MHCVPPGNVRQLAVGVGRGAARRNSLTPLRIVAVRGIVRYAPHEVNRARGRLHDD